MSTQNRQPAGTPTGGQFSTTARAEAGVALAAPDPRAKELVTLVENAFPHPDDAAAPWVISRVDAQRTARQVLADLSDDEFFNRHWFGIESAGMQMQRFAGDEDGEEAAEASPADTLGVDLGEFFDANEADRAGESAYGGYDFPRFAEAVADAWRAELGARVDRALAANDAARGARQAA